MYRRSINNRLASSFYAAPGKEEMPLSTPLKHGSREECFSSTRHAGVLSWPIIIPDSQSSSPRRSPDRSPMIVGCQPGLHLGSHDLGLAPVGQISESMKASNADAGISHAVIHVDPCTVRVDRRGKDDIGDDALTLLLQERLKNRLRRAIQYLPRILAIKKKRARAIPHP